MIVNCPNGTAIGPEIYYGIIPDGNVDWNVCKYDEAHPDPCVGVIQQSFNESLHECVGNQTCEIWGLTTGPN